MANPTFPGNEHVFVHLFEWTWNDIAHEAEQFLAPAGYRAILISPPNEHAVVAGYPWWQRYQPVSYRLDRSRSGTLAEFQHMLARCNALGIDVYADAVINHMSAASASALPLGSAGSGFEKYRYPGLYGPDDFHAERSAIRPSDYQDNAWRVQQCELEGLPDLDTGSAHVQATIAAYLVHLARLGVQGFRIDAAKHIAPGEIDAILARVEQELGWRPYYFLEVIDHGAEAVKAADYFHVRDGATQITEFKFGQYLTEKFTNASTTVGYQRLSQLRTLGQEWGMMPSAQAVVFTDNHDNQREHNLYFADGALYVLANIFMLAWPYGYPSVMSGFAFDRANPANRNIGPPADAFGNTQGLYRDAQFAAERVGVTPGMWVAEHRWPDIAAMVRFRLATAASAEVSHWWDDGENRIAFGRGALGFVVINRTDARMHQRLQTGMKPGAYRNVVGVGGKIDVDAEGCIDVTLPPLTALAIYSASPQESVAHG